MADFLIVFFGCMAMFLLGVLVGRISREENHHDHPRK